MTFDAVLLLTAVRKQAELCERRERLRPKVTILGDDVATLLVTVKTEAELCNLTFRLEQHHADSCMSSRSTISAVGPSGQCILLGKA